MSAIFGPTVPDVVTSSQTWKLFDRTEASRLLDEIHRQLYPVDWLMAADQDNEWSGAGVYRLQVRLNRPEGRPLYSLKWEGPL
jgi:hypothetical protein